MWLLKGIYELSFTHTHSNMEEIKRSSLGKVRENFFKKSREPQNRKTREKQGQGSVVQERDKHHLWKGRWVQCLQRRSGLRRDGHSVNTRCYGFCPHKRETDLFGASPHAAHKEHNGNPEPALSSLSPAQKPPSSEQPSMQNSSFLKLSSSLLKTLGYLPWERISCDRHGFF